MIDIKLHFPLHLLYIHIYIELSGCLRLNIVLLFVLLKVRNSESSWRETRKQLRKDHRWELADLLDRDEKEKLFEEHIDILNKKNKEMFHKLLDETLQVNFCNYVT